MHTDWSSLSLVLIVMILDHIQQKPTNSLSQQIRIWWYANQLKIPAKVSWAFKMVSQFGSLGYTIMGKTADLTVVQKTIIDTLHKEGKTQTFIAKEAVHRVLYPSMLTESWVEGKRCTTNRENRSLMRIVKQNRFKNLGELHKEWTEAGVGPLCFFKSMSRHPFTKTFWSTSCFLLLTSFLKKLISFPSRICHLPTLPKAPKVG